MKTVNIYVSGLPVGQPRPKARAFGGHAQVYNPKTADGWKASVIVATRNAMTSGGVMTFAGPISVRIDYVIPHPKAHYRTGKHAAELKPNAPNHHTSKPDLDNLDKATLDALTQAGAWIDDSQVCRMATTKRFGAFGEAAITIAEVEE